MGFDLMKRLEEGMEEMSQRKAFAPCASGINFRRVKARQHRQEQDAFSTTHHVHQLVDNLLQEASERSVLSPS
jgi:hypothetical protein